MAEEDEGEEEVDYPLVKFSDLAGETVSCAYSDYESDRVTFIMNSGKAFGMNGHQICSEGMLKDDCKTEEVQPVTLLSNIMQYARGNGQWALDEASTSKIYKIPSSSVYYMRYNIGNHGVFIDSRGTVKLCSELDTLAWEYFKSHPQLSYEESFCREQANWETSINIKFIYISRGLLGRHDFSEEWSDPINMFIPPF